MPLAPSWVPQNMLGLDATTLVVVVVDTDPSGSEETVADLAGVELDGGSYSRGTAEAEVTRIGDAWILFATDVDTFDLSDSDPRAGVWLATDGATDADRALIHYAPDPGAPDPAYTPTWPSGVYDLPIEAIDSILTNHDTRITTLENAPGGGGIPDPSGEDDGDVLTVSSGAAVWAPPTGGGSSWSRVSATHLGLYTDGDAVIIVRVDLSIDGPIDTPTLVDTIPVGFRPEDPLTFVASWLGAPPAYGDCLVVIDDDAGTQTSTPGGVMVMDLSGTLGPTDDVLPLLAGLTWVVAP